MSDWVPSDRTILNIPALQHKVTKELCIFGKYGEVYPNGEKYMVLARGKVKRNVAGILGYVGELGTVTCELVRPFGADKAADILNAIGIYKTIGAQEKVANGNN